MVDHSSGGENIMEWEYDGTPVVLHRSNHPFRTSPKRRFDEMSDSNELTGRLASAKDIYIEATSESLAQTDRERLAQNATSLPVSIGYSIAYLSRFCYNKCYDGAKRMRILRDVVPQQPSTPRSPRRNLLPTTRRTRYDTRNAGTRSNLSAMRRSSSSFPSREFSSLHGIEQERHPISPQAFEQEESIILPGSLPPTPDPPASPTKGPEPPTMQVLSDWEPPSLPGAYPASPAGACVDQESIPIPTQNHNINLSRFLNAIRPAWTYQAATQDSVVSQDSQQLQTSKPAGINRRDPDLFGSDQVGMIDGSDVATPGRQRGASGPIPPAPIRRLLQEIDNIYNECRTSCSINEDEAASAQLQQEFRAAVQAGLNRFSGPLTPPETPPPYTRQDADLGMSSPQKFNAHGEQDAEPTSDTDSLSDDEAVRFPTPALRGDDSSPTRNNERDGRSHEDITDLQSEEPTISLVKEVETLQLSSKPDSLAESGRRQSLRQTRKAQQDREAQALQAQQEAEAEARRVQEEEESKAQRKKDYEERVQREGILRIPQTPVVQSLSADHDAMVNEALKKGMQTQVALTVTGNPITRRDIGKVLPQPGTSDDASGWLNDEVIQAYLEMVVAHGGQNKRSKIPRYHAFNTFFYNNLRTKGYEGVRRWAKKAKFGGKDLLGVEYIFVPVNKSGNHWTMAIISPSRRTIQYYDSLHGSSSEVLAKLHSWLEGELGSAYNGEEWTVLEQEGYKARGRGPTQLNGSDCGVFAITTAKLVMLGVDPMAVSGRDMQLQRRRVVAEVLSGGFTGPFSPVLDFTELDEE